MNLTVCTKDDPKGKVIRNWGKCLRCSECRLIIARYHQGKEILHPISVYLFRCPHVTTRHLKIGKDTYRSQPRLRTDLIPTTFTLLGTNIPGLRWESYEPPIEGSDLTEIAEIPRDLWGELFLNT